MELKMDTKLEQLASDFHEFLKAEPGPKGREKVAQRLKDVLIDADFQAAHFGPDTGTRKLLYEDGELGFCILAHAYEGAAESRPHDHGPSWAIYGQAEGETEMTEWDLVEPASADKPGRVRPAKTYTMTPGSAYVYNAGVLHSPKRSGPTRLIRIEGTNMDRVSRFRYEPV